MWKHVRFYAAGAVTAAAACLSLATASGQRAVASTTVCASNCSSPYTQLGGGGEVLTVSLKQAGGSCSTVTAAALASGNCAVSVGMAAASGTNAGQDWLVLQESAGSADVSSFVTAGLMNRSLGALYGSDLVYEIEAAPDGVPSGQCLSDTLGQFVSANDSGYYGPGAGVSLAPCGEPYVELTVYYYPTAWIEDLNVNGYTDLISGLNFGFSHPYVLTAATSGTSTSLSAAPLASSGWPPTPREAPQR